MNRVRFTGQFGRRTLPPGTYTVTAQSRTSRSLRNVVVVILPRTGTVRERSSSCAGLDENSSMFETLAAAFDAGAGGTAGTGTSAAALRSAIRRGEERASNEKGKRPGGVLPAISRKVRGLPEVLPRAPLPKLSDEPGTAPKLLGLAALALLALSGIAIVAYVIRFLRGPGTRSA